ncbi:uncharacterized protein LOC143360442 [Halictus rubicundus]|uniref:uncharacterized protein LOC143360442 n=1 Tax=Halictus rubicundus TaxID=77578 RepID=UPI004037244B
MHPPVPMNTIQYQQLTKRLDRKEEKIDKILNKEGKPGDCGKKPQCLPLRTMEEVDQFENCSDEDYGNVIDYFTYVGGCNLKEALSASFKEAFPDSLLPLYTWFGTDRCQPLYPTKIVRALFDAACKSKAFKMPTRLEFQDSMRMLLKARKERIRNKKPSGNAARLLPNPWVEEQQS